MTQTASLKKINTHLSVSLRQCECSWGALCKKKKLLNCVCCFGYRLSCWILKATSIIAWRFWIAMPILARHTCYDHGHTCYGHTCYGHTRYVLQAKLLSSRDHINLYWHLARWITTASLTVHRESKFLWPHYLSTEMLNCGQFNFSLASWILMATLLTHWNTCVWQASLL
jgi:hypothetical protein